MNSVQSEVCLFLLLSLSSLGTRNGFFQRHEALVRHDEVGCICGLACLGGEVCSGHSFFAQMVVWRKAATAFPSAKKRDQ